uniref:CSD domain-containing protein n=1 Tax=Myotis lucifugus TaxID=59463 RepID=G1QAJ3_MYOLU
GGCDKVLEEAPDDSARAAVEPQLLHRSLHLYVFSVHMGFGSRSMTSPTGVVLNPPVDVFVQQSKLYLEGCWRLKEGEAVEFIFKKSSEGHESIRDTGAGWVLCIGSERSPKGKNMQKCKSGRQVAQLTPQPKMCHFCQSISHLV